MAMAVILVSFIPSPSTIALRPAFARRAVGPAATLRRRTPTGVEGKRQVAVAVLVRSQRRARAAQPEELCGWPCEYLKVASAMGSRGSQASFR